MILLAAALSLAQQPVSESITFELNVRDVDQQVQRRSYEAVIERPEKPNGWKVMLLSGSYAVDLDWTVPGSYADGQGNKVQLTLDGKPTRDAATISRELQERGFTVWRYSSIHAQDQLHAENPAFAEVSPFGDTIKIARAAFENCARHEPDGPVVFLGHSLGATRGTWIGADADRVKGFVFLAGAYLSDWDGRVNALPEIAPDGPDVDGDGVIRGWEAASAEASQQGKPADRPERFRNTLEWPIDALIRAEKPVLAIYGSLDPITVHGPVLAKRAELSGAPIRVEYVHDRDHQLAETRNGLITAIDPAVIDRIGDWLEALRTGHTKDKPPLGDEPQGLGSD